MVEQLIERLKSRDISNIREFESLVVPSLNNVYIAKLVASWRTYAKWCFELGQGNLLAEVEKLDLSYYEKDFLPQDLWRLKRLKHLSCLSGKLKGISSEISNLRELEILYFNYNQISALPKELSTLGNLKELWLLDNQLEALPLEMN
ncbi:MAG: leucine-rich repeat domain-containing protein, partial [Bacteroidota bacterium]